MVRFIPCKQGLLKHLLGYHGNGQMAGFVFGSEL